MDIVRSLELESFILTKLTKPFVHPTAVVLLQPLVFLLQPPKPAPVVSHAPSSHGRLCYRGGLIAPFYSHH